MERVDSGAKIVVIGGGTGSFMVLSGLKNYASDITALVSMADDGGSTGVLRDELGVLPPGDVRQCLVALSRSPMVRDLFNYRFNEGTFAGHSFGNLFLTATEKMTGKFSDGVRVAGEVLQITGRVEPVTLDNVTLCMKDGKRMLRQERNIDTGEFKTRHPKLWLEPKPKVNKTAISAIMAADVVVLAPGSLYTSLGAALIVPGVAEALEKTKAKKVYIANLVNKPNQTDGFTVVDYVTELERLAGRKFIDIVLYNTRTPIKKLVEKYKHEHELLVNVGDKKGKHYKLIGSELVVDAGKKLIRHDSDKVARRIMKVFFS